MNFCYVGRRSLIMPGVVVPPRQPMISCLLSFSASDSDRFSASFKFLSIFTDLSLLDKSSILATLPSLPSSSFESSFSFSPSSQPFSWSFSSSSSSSPKASLSVVSLSAFYLRIYFTSFTTLDILFLNAVVPFLCLGYYPLN